MLIFDRRLADLTNLTLAYRDQILNKETRGHKASFKI